LFGVSSALILLVRPRLDERAGAPQARLLGLARIRYTGRDVLSEKTRRPESTWMSELSERRWAVLSERGSEAAGLTYEEASALVGELRGRDVSGLCVITDEAAGHLPPARKGDGKASGGGNSKKPRRGGKKGAA